MTPEQRLTIAITGDLTAEPFSCEQLEAWLAANKNERQREAVRRRFGFHDGRPWLLGEVAALFGGITRERVRQLEAIGLRKLRRCWREQPSDWRYVPRAELADLRETGPVLDQHRPSWRRGLL